MSRISIEAKLTLELGSDHELTEVLVVYLLVEIRKMLEIYGEKKVFSALYFFCNWALHSRLSGREAGDIVKEFDKLEDAWVESEGDYEGSRRNLSGTLGAERFRRELSDFLSSHSLPNSLCEKRDRWNRFLKQYGGVIHDSPLELGDASNTYIEKVIVQRVDEPTWPDGMDMKDFLFSLHWIPIRFDGKSTVRQVVDFWASAEDF